jgi:hypothetical protein
MSIGSRVARPTEEGTAAGIYSVIVSGAVMAASHARSAVAVTVAVLVTLIVYWSAERYSRLMAARIHDGHRPHWPQVRFHLTRGWEIVTASFLPLAVLLLLSLVGVGLDAATLAALSCITVLLFLTGWEMGWHGRLSTMTRIGSASVAALFGIALTVLKAMLH